MKTIKEREDFLGKVLLELQEIASKYKITIEGELPFETARLVHHDPSSEDCEVEVDIDLVPF